jgi:hypothetical protein
MDFIQMSALVQNKTKSCGWIHYRNIVWLVLSNNHPKKKHTQKKAKKKHGSDFVTYISRSLEQS